jgi:ferritin-like metal-binding protein YciE
MDTNHSFYTRRAHEVEAKAVAALTPEARAMHAELAARFRKHAEESEHELADAGGVLCEGSDVL